MEEAQNLGDQSSYMLTEFNTRLRDLDERNRLIRERVLLLGKNVIEVKEDLEEELDQIKKDNLQIKQDLEKIKRISKNLVTDFEKFVKRDELNLVERMLKDFEPLEFARKKDIESLVKEIINKNK